jgi:DNA sulfur modification protein DndD
MMSDVHFHEISIKGFRGRNFNLKMNPRGQHTVFIMDGNTGKTTTIELLRWCFRFKETDAVNKFEHMWEVPAHIFDDTKKGHQICTIEIIFSAFDNNNEHLFKFQRTAEGEYDPNYSKIGDKVKSIHDFLEVDKGKEVYSHDSAFEYLDKNFRFKDCHEYFCFDGEKAREIMQITGNPEKIIRLMESIESRTKHLPLQIIRTHLETLRQEIHELARSRITDRAIQKNCTELEKKENERKLAEKEISKIDLEIRANVQAISNLNEELNQKNKKIIEEKVKNLITKNNFENKQKQIVVDINNKRYQIYKNYKNLFWSENLDITNKIKSEIKERGRLPEPYRENLIQDCIRERKCQICNRPLDENAINSIKNLERQIAPHSVQIFLEKPFSIPQNEMDLDAIRDEIENLINEYNDLEIKINSLNLSDEEIQKISELDKIKEQISEFESNAVKFSRDKEDLEELVRTLKKEKSELEKKIGILQENKYILDAIDRAMEILDQTEEQIKNTAIEIIGQAISSGISSILGPTFSARLSQKDGLLLGENNVYTTGKGGYSGRLILAYCFAEAMTLIDPIIIDTPVGNIGSHRKALANHLMKNHKQIILFCLPTEINDFGNIISQNPIEIKNIEV